MSAPLSADTLNQVLNDAYRANPKLDAARATLRASDEEVARANSGYRPVVTGNADVGYQNLNSTGVNGSSSSTESHPRGYGITAVQPLFRGGRVLNGVSVAEATVRAGREILRGVEQTVLLDSATSYMDVIRDQAILNIRENNVRVLSTELKQTKDRFSVGEVTRTDVAQSEARRAVSISALEAARSALRTSRAAFERNVGRPAGKLVEPRLDERRLPRSQEDAIAISQRENPVVIAALYREQGARSTIDQIWGELLPSMQLTTSYNRRFDPSSLLQETNTASVVASVTVPLYSGGEVQARVRQAKQTHIGRIQEIEQNRQEVQANVVTAWAQFQAAKAQLTSDTAQVAAFTTALNGVREEEKVGQRTLLDVLNAEQELLNAQVSLVSTRRNIIVASHTLLSTVGRLNIQELGSSDKVYDPEVHYKEVRRQPWGVSVTKNDDRATQAAANKDSWATSTRAGTESPSNYRSSGNWKPVK